MFTKYFTLGCYIYSNILYQAPTSVNLNSFSMMKISVMSLSFCIFSDSDILILFFFSPHYRPKSPSKTTTVQQLSSQSIPTNNVNNGSSTSSTGQPRPRIHRSFSTQPRSKFSLNTCPSNGLVGTNFTHANPAVHCGNGSLPNGPVVTQSGHNSSGTWTSSPFNATTNKNAYSTAPIKAVYALNFPLNSSTSNQLLSNSLVRGNAPFSPTSSNSSSLLTATKTTSSFSNISTSR